MTKDQAREILEEWVLNDITHYSHVRFPIKDITIQTIKSNGLNKPEISEHSFLGLIKIAYDLTEKTNEGN